MTPRINAAKKSGEWQSVDVTLVGRSVTITLNGELIIDRQEIPGITGGSLDSEAGQTGAELSCRAIMGRLIFRRPSRFSTGK